MQKYVEVNPLVLFTLFLFTHPTTIHIKDRYKVTQNTRIPGSDARTYNNQDYV
jgi:hypothetical protein